MKPRSCVLLLIALFLALSSQSVLLGQSRGTITGTVYDESGAVLPGADVTVTNQATGDVRKTVTSEEGFFSVVALPAATYTLEVDLPGFAGWRRTDIILESAMRMNISDIILKVSGVAEEVTVSSASDMIAPVDSGEKSATLSAEQIQNIPIVGRNAAELLRVLPGMSPIGDPMTNQPNFNGEVIGINGNGAGGDQSPLGNYSANGTRSGQMNIVFDGGNVADPGCNCATPVNPNPDMISEFKVLTSNYGAEHAKGPIVIDAVSKAGTNEFHGTGYFAFRHWKLNANEWEFNKLDRDRTANEFYYPGFNIGGPLTPGRDKLFFFVGMEWMRQTLDTGTLRAVVPTAANRQGNFSTSEVSNLAAGSDRGLNAVPTGDGIVDGIIDSSAIDPGGQVLLNLMPMPNTDPSMAAGHNWVEALTLSQPNTQQLMRVDYSVSENTKIFARYNRQRETQPFVTTFWWFNANDVPYPSRIIGDNRSDALSASLTHVFSPTVTNESLFTLTFVGFPNTFEEPDKVNREKLGYPYEGIFKNGMLQIPSITSWGGGAATMVNPYMPASVDPAQANHFADKWMVSASDNFVKIAGTHTLKAGIFWEWVENDQFATNNAQGQIVYAPWHDYHTGNSYADLLMGRISQFDHNNFASHHQMAYHTVDFYANDSWKATPRLTIDAGLRFSYMQPWTDETGTGMAVWNGGSYDGSLSLEENYDVVTGSLWHAKDSSVPLGGADPKSLFVMPRLGAAYDLSGNGDTVLRGGIGWFRFHDEQSVFAGTMGLPQGERGTSVCCGYRLSDLDAQSASRAMRFGIGALSQGDKEMARTISYSFTIQQRIPWQQMLEVGYVGNSQDFLVSNGGYWQNVNAVPRGAMLGLEDPDSANADDYRPLSLYQAVNVFTHTMWSNYNGLQVLLSRNAGWFNYMASYTWSKALGIRGTGFDGGNCGAETPEECYGPLQFDRSQVFNISYNLQIPGPSSASTAVRALLDGWQVTGISNYVSGGNLQTSNPNFGLQGSTADGTNLSNRAWLGTPDLTLQPVLTCNPSEGLADGQFINPSCFALPQQGTNGMVIFPYIKGPSYFNHDLSFNKNWNLGEDRRLQFRFSMFNMFNHPLKRLEDQNLVLTFENGAMVNDRFGKFDDDPRKLGRRIIQMGFKFFF